MKRQTGDPGILISRDGYNSYLRRIAIALGWPQRKPTRRSATSTRKALRRSIRAPLTRRQEHRILPVETRQATQAPGRRRVVAVVDGSTSTRRPRIWRPVDASPRSRGVLPSWDATKAIFCGS